MAAAGRAGWRAAGADHRPDRALRRRRLRRRGDSSHPYRNAHDDGDRDDERYSHRHGHRHAYAATDSDVGRPNGYAPAGYRHARAAHGHAAGASSDAPTTHHHARAAHGHTTRAYGNALSVRPAMQPPLYVRTETWELL